MPKVEYTDSDLWVKDELERLFWIELAKRKAHQQQADSFSMLLTLRCELETFFESHVAELEEPFDGGTDAFFDAIQFDRCIESTVADQQHVDLLRTAFDRYEGRARSVIDNLSYYQGFRLADFSVVTDLEALHDWWTWIISGEGRNKLAATGKFSSMGDMRPVPATEEIWFEGDDSPSVNVGECINTISSFTNPVRIPRRVDARQVWAFVTDDHEITIDDCLLEDRLVLDFDLLKPLPSMRQIELAARSAQAAALARRRWAKLQAGIFPEDLLSVGIESRAPDILQLMLTPHEDHKLMVEQKSAAPLIFGFYCWDLVAAGKSDAQACKLAVNTLLSISGNPFYSERRAIYGLQEVVRPKIEAYEPSQLPWYD
jgi:hypothetical protein